MTQRLVEHTPIWAPADLRYNEAGDTKPGYRCVHPLENDNGLCGGSTYDPAEDREGETHACVVDDEAE